MGLSMEMVSLMVILVLFASKGSSNHSRWILVLSWFLEWLMDSRIYSTIASILKQTSARALASRQSQFACDGSLAIGAVILLQIVLGAVDNSHR